MTPARPRAVLLATLTTAALAVVGPPAAADPVAPPTTTVVWTEDDSGTVAVRALDASGVERTIGSGPYTDPVAMSEGGSVYVTDGSDVFAYAPGASSPVRLAAGLGSITDLAVDSRGNVYAVDFFVGIFRIDAVTGAVSAVLPDGPGYLHFAIAVDADDDLIATRDVSSPRRTEVVELPADGGPVQTLFSRPGITTALAVAPDDTLVLATSGGSGQAELRRVSRDGTVLGTSTAAGSEHLVDAGPGGSVYLARYAGAVVEHSLTSGTTRTLLGTSGPVYGVAAAPAWVREPPLRPRRDPDSGPDPVPDPAPVAVVTKAQPRLGAGRLAVRAEHLVPGEAYEIRLRGLVRHRGVVGPDGVVEQRVRVSSRLSGTRRLKVVGAVSGVVSMVFEVAQSSRPWS